MHPLRPGDPERIGAFSIVGLLGEGPRGAVFLGRESEDAPKVAIKLLPAEPESDREPDRYLGAKRVSSSYVARVLDAGYHDDRPYVVREYVEGKSLAETVADGEPLTGDALERVAVGVLTALSAVHLAGLAHRSLTPHNVILGPDGPRVTDAAIGDPVGDAAYQAPEQLEGRPYGPYADVFAWAATIVYAGTGRPPFADREAALNGDPDVGITAEPLRRVLLSALTREVGSRPTTYSALMQVLGDAPKTPDTPAAKPEAAAAAAAAVAPAPAAPAADSSKTDAPTPAAPKPAEPAADGPEPGGPAAETAESGQPEVGEQKPDGPVADASKPNEPVAGEPKAGAPVAAESKAGAPGPQSGGAGGEGPEAPAPRRAPEGPPLEGVTIARLPMPGGPPQGPPMQGPLQGPLQGPPQGPQFGPHVPPQGPPPSVPAQGGPRQGMPQGGVPMRGPLQGPPHGPLSGPNLPPQGPPSGPHMPPPHVPGPPLQGTPVPGPGMQGPGMHGPGMQGPQGPGPQGPGTQGPGVNVPVPHQQGGPESQAPPQLQGRPVTPESTMWGPPEADPPQPPAQIRIERSSSPAPRRGLPLALIAAVATVALVAAVGLWGANRYVRLQQVEPASVAQENTDGIPTPSGTATGPAPQGTDPANPQATAEATVPWAASNDTDDVGPLVLPTEWSSATPDVPELTTAPTTPSALPTTPVVVPTQPPATVTKRAQPTKKQQATQAPKAKATVTKTVQPTPKPTKTTPKAPVRTPTKRPDPTPTQEPEPQPTKTTAKPQPTKTTAKPAAPVKNPYTATQVCGSGFSVQRSASFSGGVTYQLWNNSTGQNCAVTIKTADVGKSTSMGVTLEAQGGGSQSDNGSFEYYAGPVKVSAKGKCVRISGYVGSGSTSTGWANCG